MAERNAEGGGSFPLNLNTLLVLLTLASSVWLVSQKLTSTRPAAPAGKLRDFPGEQRVESRLWEDPFKTPEQHSKGDDPTGTNLTTLLKQIERRSFPQSKLASCGMHSPSVSRLERKSQVSSTVTPRAATRWRLQ